MLLGPWGRPRIHRWSPGLGALSQMNNISSCLLPSLYPLSGVSPSLASPNPLSFSPFSNYIPSASLRISTCQDRDRRRKKGWMEEWLLAPI